MAQQKDVLAMQKHQYSEVAQQKRFSTTKYTADTKRLILFNMQQTAENLNIWAADSNQRVRSFASRVSAV